MASDEATPTSFLGTGWSFPPEFVKSGQGQAARGAVRMTADEEDIRASLRVLFGTVRGERFLNPTYGLSPQELLFEPLSTTLGALMADQMRISVLLFEPRIEVLALDLTAPEPNDGTLSITLSYRVRATNSRFNLVFPFYRTDGNEVRRMVDAGP